MVCLSLKVLYKQTVRKQESEPCGYQGEMSSRQRPQPVQRP